MKSEKVGRLRRFAIRGPQPICVGTGLVALDVIVDNTKSALPPTLRAGGSCGNVLTILSYFGWKVYPIARLQNDTAAERLVEDLATWSVNIDFVSRTIDGSTPVIMEKIKLNNKGLPYHKFEWACPSCGSWFPRFKPVLARSIPQICTQIPTPQVFYFDRPTRGALEMAKMSKSRGAITFFEPSAIVNNKLFHECLHLADIVKYSEDRLENLPGITERQSIPLEIETKGIAGLRYRRAQQNGEMGQWTELPSYPVLNFQDAAGAGDWCSAGLIHRLCSLGHGGLHNALDEDLWEALAFGQALGSASCAFTGPRGNMYSFSPQNFEDLVVSTLQGEVFTRHDLPNQLDPPSNPVNVWQDVCVSCRNRDFSADLELAPKSRTNENAFSEKYGVS